MDSLLNTVKQGNQLLQSAPTPGQAAAPSAPSPTNPVDASVLGANADQAKMAGTPTQTAGAVRQAVKSSQDLQTTLRRQQANATASAAQQQAQQAAQDVGQVGDIQARVPQLMAKAQNDQLAQVGTGLSTQLAVDETNPTYAALPPAKQAQLKAALGTIGNKGATSDQVNQALVQANYALGHTADNDRLSADELHTLFLAPTAGVGAALANATPATVTLGMLQPADLGLKDWATLETDLGLPAGSAAKMTVEQLGTALQAFKQQGYQTADSWKQVLGDPTSSQQARDTARFMLKEMGASGVSETESKVTGLVHQVQAANQVTFLGKTMDIKTALSDDTLKAAAANYFDGSDNGALRASNPDLANWLDANKAAVSGLLGGVDNEARAYAAIQTGNQALSQVGDNLAVPNDVMQKLVPGWGQQSAVAFAQPPLLASLATMHVDPAAPAGTSPKAQLVGLMSDLSGYGDVGAGMLADLGSHTVDQLEAKGLTTKEGIDSYKAAASSYYAVARAASTPGVSADDLFTSIFGTNQANTASSVESISKAANLFGGPGLEGRAGALAPGGGLVTADQLAGAIKKAGAPTVDTWQQGTTSLQGDLATSKTDTASYAATLAPWEKSLYNLVSSGKEILPKDIAAAAGQLTDPKQLGDLDKLSALTDKAGLSAAPVQQAIQRVVGAATDSAVAGLGIPGVSNLATATAVLGRIGNASYVQDASSFQSAQDLINSLQKAATAPGTDPRVAAKLNELSTKAVQALGNARAGADAAARAANAPKLAARDSDLKNAKDGGTLGKLQSGIDKIPKMPRIASW